jgi:hypothetical protein
MLPPQVKRYPQEDVLAVAGIHEVEEVDAAGPSGGR